MGTLRRPATPIRSSEEERIPQFKEIRLRPWVSRDPSTKPTEVPVVDGVAVPATEITVHRHQVPLVVASEKAPVVPVGPALPGALMLALPPRGVSPVHVVVVLGRIQERREAHAHLAHAASLTRDPVVPTTPCCCRDGR